MLRADPSLWSWAQFKRRRDSRVDQVKRNDPTRGGIPKKERRNNLFSKKSSKRARGTTKRERERLQGEGEKQRKAGRS